jgi:hypothetical protein
MMSDLLTIFGTLEPPVQRQTLAAGPLTAVLEAGQLRDIRWHGALVLRGIAYLLRDADWGTLQVELSDLAVEEDATVFRVSYTARADGLTYAARIEGRADGQLVFSATAKATADFLTNRTGFVVLHPDTAAGGPLVITHGDGTEERTVFPARILPDQPAFDIAALTHHPAPGLVAVTRLAGGVFEMEDQRNWADASFKTYVRPVAWPRPYTLPAGSSETQSVALEVTGAPQPEARPAAPVLPAMTVPPLWLRLDPRQPVPDRLCLPGLAHGLILRCDALPDPSRLAAAVALAAREGMELAVEVALPARDAGAEAAELSGALADHALPLVMVSLSRDARTRPSGSLPDGERPFDEIAAALRSALPGQQFAFGTPAFFTEFNRNPPPPGSAAFFSVAATVHAADDASVMETLGVLPEIARSAALRCPGAGLVPGPLTLAPTVSPYAPSLAVTDGTTRTCMAAHDPRHAALFGATHLVGVVAALAPASLALAPAFATGPWGLAGPDGAPLPLAHVHVAIAAARGRPLLRATVGETLAEIEWQGGAITANLSASRVLLGASQHPQEFLSATGWCGQANQRTLSSLGCVRWNR